MPATLAITCARLLQAAYAMPLVPEPPTPDLSALGHVCLSKIMGVDNLGVGAVPFGFVSDGPEGTIVTLRGTQCPGGSLVEWLDDCDALLEDCPLCIAHPTGIPAPRWHRGFGRVFSSLTAAGLPLADYLGREPQADIYCGHSLGGPLATYAALAGGSGTLVLLASPKPGDLALSQAVEQRIDQALSFANPNDAVPRLPITVDWPWAIWDFVPVLAPLELQPDTVTPPIAADWHTSHSLASYLSLLEAMP